MSHERHSSGGWNLAVCRTRSPTIFWRYRRTFGMASTSSPVSVPPPSSGDGDQRLALNDAGERLSTNGHVQRPLRNRQREGHAPFEPRGEGGDERPVHGSERHFTT